MPPGRKRLKGRVISSGVAFGIARVDEPFSFPSTQPKIAQNDVEAELAKLSRARDLVRAHLEEHVRGVHSPAEEDLQQIVAAHVLMMDDRGFFGSIEERIRGQLLSADRAVSEAFSAAASRMAASDDCYMRTRAEDIRDICQSVRRALAYDTEAFRPREVSEESVVHVVPHLLPSTVLRARREGAVGFVTSSTAFTSHGAILLRAAGIPALGSVVLDGSGIRDGARLLVDAVHGELVVNPRSDELNAARAEVEAVRSVSGDLALPPLDAELKGGGAVSLYANIDHPSQAALCISHRLRGVGLLRTELLVLDQGAVPDEETQYRTLLEFVHTLAGRPLVVRTFDFGADKEAQGLNECLGQNPALGLRGIRRHLHRFPGELKTQLRAILRAAVGSDVSILLPMVTHAGDVQAARAYLIQVSEELASQGVPFNPAVKVGAMLEIPSAVLQVGELLGVVDFLSVGTNDLVQYLTAADRENPAVLDYQNVEGSGLHQILEFAMKAARAVGRQGDMSVCGELASDPQAARDLVRLGFRSLSVTPQAAGSVREALRTLTVPA